MKNNQESHLSTDVELSNEVEFFHSDVSSDTCPETPTMWGESVQY